MIEEKKVEINENKLTFQPEQQRVLDSAGKNVIVSASAGSGKTTVMIQKLINLITKQGVDVKELLVLTYTKASAEEMKQKLVNALYEVCESDESFLNQIDDVATADISTIHSFFQKLIKRNFMAINLNPSFKVIEEEEAEVLKNEALKNCVENLSLKSPDRLARLLDYYGKSRNDKTIKKLLEKINIFLGATYDIEFFCKHTAFTFCEENLNKNLAVYILNKEICDIASYYKTEFLKFQKQAENFNLGDYVINLGEIILGLEQIKITDEEKFYFKEFDNAGGLEVKNLKFGEKAPETSFFKNYQILSSFSFSVLRKNKDFEDFYLEIYEFREKLKKSYIEKYASFDYTIETVSASIREIRKTIEILLDLNGEFEKEYATIKRKKNALDFNDLEKFALEILQNESVREDVKNQYKYIYVDEYQDANILQEKILSLISSNNNRFMVGDVKQSIYGFRQAEPDIFLSIQEKFSRDENSEALSLNSNFRSHKNILEFVNKVFSEVMTLGTAKIDYKKSHKLNPMAKYENILSEKALENVEIEIIKTEKETEKPLPPKVYSVIGAGEFVKTEESKTAFLEARLVAKKISQIIGKKIFDPKLKTEREIQFKDICLLLNSRGEYLDQFCSVLADFNIPLYANTNASLYDDEEILIFINLIKLVVNSSDDIALATCLHSLFGALSYNQLAIIRLCFSEEKAFFDCVRQFLKVGQVIYKTAPSSISEVSNIRLDGADLADFSQRLISNKVDLEEFKEVFVKLYNFNIFLRDFKFDVNYKGFYYAFNNIIQKFDYFSYLYQRADGLEKVGKLKKFVEDFNRNKYNQDPIGFINFVENSPELVKAPNYISGDNCVSITTIHSSKGIEYPVVFLLNAGQDLGGKPRDSDIELNNNFGIALKRYDSEKRLKNMSVVFQAMRQVNKTNEFAEKLRLLYVALTRPKNHLYIIGTTAKPFKKLFADFQIKRTNNFLDLIVGALDEAEIYDLNQNKPVINELYKINLHSPQDLASNEKLIQKRLVGKGDENLTQIFKDYFAKKLPEKNNVALKNSVTSLASADENTYASLNFAPSKLTLSEHLQDNALQVNQIGTDYHEILEELDFSQIKSVEEIQNILEKRNKTHLSAQKIYNCVLKLKEFNFKKAFKEQKFMLYIPHKEVVENGSDEKILIQGVIDLLLLGKENVLIDYKFTSLTDAEKIKQRYKFQLSLYKKAVENAQGIKIHKSYILLINTAQLIEI